MKRFVYLWVFMLLLCGSLAAQEKAKPMDYAQFSTQEGMEMNEGYFTVYRLGNSYYLEIPADGMGRDVLITTQVVKGYSAYVSESSGVIRFSQGREGRIHVTRNRAMDVSADTTDVRMMEALRKSGMVPVDYVYPVVAYGEDGQSVIIDITNELNGANGNLFNVSKNSSLNQPDPSRSGIDGFRMIDGGVVFSATRSQTNFQTTDMQTGAGQNFPYTYELEMVIQMLPEHEVTMKRNHPAFGFNTIGMLAYDTKKYVAQRTEYVQKWQLMAKDQKQRGENEYPICVYIDPIIPAPFVESVKRGLRQWEEAFAEAGWTNVFRVSSSPEDASLAYRTILVRWGAAFNGLYSSVVVNPENGEILCARINLMDASADEMLGTYFLQCGLLDERIRKDLHSLAVRQDVLTAQFASAFAELLGMKPNRAGYTAFSPEALRSEKQLDKQGTTTSITSDLRFNYIARPDDNISVANLFPKVSTYDKEAIAYAYGNREKGPSLKAAFYQPKDPQKYNPDTELSDDLFEAGLLAIENLKEVYPHLDKWIKRLPEEQRTWDAVADMSIKALALYQTYLTQMVNCVGGVVTCPIVKGENDIPVRYVSKERQEEVLAYLEKVIFNGAEQWIYEPGWEKVSTYDLDQLMVGLAAALSKRFIDEEAIAALIDGERVLGVENAFLATDLFAYVDRVIFENFDETKALSDFKRNLQLQFVSDFAKTMAQKNISFGLGNEAVNMLHVYFIDMAQKVKHLAETHQDPMTRENYRLLWMRLERDYFQKNN